VKYTVVWKPAAEADLARIWTRAADRGAVAAAADETDRLLRYSPHEQGESRSGSVRLMLIRPLGVFYEVSEADRMVHVLAVRRTPS